MLGWAEVEDVVEAEDPAEVIMSLAVLLEKQIEGRTASGKRAVDHAARLRAILLLMEG